MPRIRAGGFLECCDMLRAGLVALRRFGVSVWFAMLRFGVTRRTGSRWHGMTYRECAAMRRYASGRGARYGSLWFGSPGVGGASLRVTFPDGAARASGALWRTCRAMSRNGAARGIPRVFRYVPLDRLQRSRPPLQWNGCRVCYVGFALFPIGRDFFQGTGPPSGCRCRNTRR